MEYKKCKLRNIAHIIMGQSPNGTSYNNNGNGKAFLQGNKTFGRLYPIIDTWTTEPKKIAKKDSILMSVRAPVGDLNIANEEICIGRGLCSIEMNNGNNKYLLYLLKNSINEIKRKSSGTVFDSINRTELEEIDIIDFNENIQNKIIDILSRVDEKIELNNQINDNLYKILNEVFKYWFETFEKFKEQEFKETEIGNIPNEFSVIELSDLIDIKGGLAYKASKLSDNKEDNILVSMGNVELNNIFNFNHLKYYNDNVNNKYIIDYGDLFICTRDVTQQRNQLGCPGIIPKNLKNKTVIIGTNLYRVYYKKYNKDLNRYLFLLLNSFRYRERIVGSAKGTAVLMISKDDILKFKLAFPDNNQILSEFNNIINPIFDKIENNICENETLTKLRDTLLPKLMNGEIDLENIEM